jgi:ribosomal-protein-alanine N-acetyltransferase
LRVRRANAEDVQAMVDLDRQAPSAAHWSRQQYEDLFRADPHPSSRFAWIVEDGNPAQSESAKRDASKTLAFLVTRCVAGEWELENIVVDTTFRGKGIGMLLLRELISHARANHGECIFLEVRHSNQSARALYEKLGFEEEGLRKSYYANPVEDAILYRLNLG